MPLTNFWIMSLSFSVGKGYKMSTNHKLMIPNALQDQVFQNITRSKSHHTQEMIDIIERERLSNFWDEKLGLCWNEFKWERFC